MAETHGSIHGPTNRDRLTNSVMHTLPLEEVVRDQWTTTGAEFPPSRVISTVSPVVVRQNSPSGPIYQEALGYSFLLNSPKYPGLCKMDDGTLVLTLTAALSGETVNDAKRRTFLDENTRTDVILYSKDDGLSWSQPRRIPGYRTTPMNLGGKRLMLRGWSGKKDLPETFRFWFSEDMGDVWSDPESVSFLPDGGGVITDVAMSFSIEDDTVRFMFFRYPDPDDRHRAATVMRPYNHSTHEWGEPSYFPKEFLSSEASLTRAKNGDLVASFRSARPGIPTPFDGWRSIVTAYSTDDGLSWSDPAIHSLYGHVHHSLITLPDGRILMTYAARIGELEGRTYHGHEAVFSHDNGRTWDWERRYILFRGTDHAQHSPQSVLLSDGSILTVVMHPVTYTWGDGETRGNLIGLSNVSIVIWSPSATSI